MVNHSFLCLLLFFSILSGRYLCLLICKHMHNILLVGNAKETVLNSNNGDTLLPLSSAEHGDVFILIGKFGIHYLYYIVF